jgi:hypothetical protein
MELLANQALAARPIRRPIGYPGPPTYLGDVYKGEINVSEFESKYTAQNLMALHGLRAQAVVRERITEARQQGDTTGLERWQNVEAAISELRRTAPARTDQGAR